MAESPGCGPMEADLQSSGESQPGSPISPSAAVAPDAAGSVALARGRWKKLTHSVHDRDSDWKMVLGAVSNLRRRASVANFGGVGSIRRGSNDSCTDAEAVAGRRSQPRSKGADDWDTHRWEVIGDFLQQDVEDGESNDLDDISPLLEEMPQGEDERCYPWSVAIAVPNPCSPRFFAAGRREFSDNDVRTMLERVVLRAPLNNNMSAEKAAERKRVEIFIAMNAYKYLKRRYAMRRSIQFCVATLLRRVLVVKLVMNARFRVRLSRGAAGSESDSIFVLVTATEECLQRCAQQWKYKVPWDIEVTDPVSLEPCTSQFIPLIRESVKHLPEVRQALEGHLSTIKANGNLNTKVGRYFLELEQYCMQDDLLRGQERNLHGDAASDDSDSDSQEGAIVHSSSQHISKIVHDQSDNLLHAFKRLYRGSHQGSDKRGLRSALQRRANKKAASSSSRGRLAEGEVPVKAGETDLRVLVLEYLCYRADGATITEAIHKANQLADDEAKSVRLKCLWQWLKFDKPAAACFPYTSEGHPSKLWRLVEQSLATGEAISTPFEEVDRLKLVLAGCKRHIDFDQAVNFEMLDAVFPLHDTGRKEELLSGAWIYRRDAAMSRFKSWRKWMATEHAEGVQTVRTYFGEKVALYFGFLRNYVKSVRNVALTTLPLFMLTTLNIILIEYFPTWQDIGLTLKWCIPLLFAFRVVLWYGSWFYHWREVEKRFGILWGNKGKVDSARTLLEGHLRRDVSTDEDSVYFASAHRRARYAMSFLVTTGMLMVSLAVNLTIIASQHFLVISTSVQLFQQFYAFVLPLAQSFFVLMFSNKYSAVAKELTQRENHRTERVFEQSMIIKLFLFDFFNTLNPCFIYAFVKPHVLGCIPYMFLRMQHNEHGMVEPTHNDVACDGELNRALISLLMAMVTKNVAQIGIPYIRQRTKMFDISGIVAVQQMLHVGSHADEFLIHDVEEALKVESSMDKYGEFGVFQDGTFEDYKEIVMMHAIVVFFGTTLQIVPVVVWILACLEEKIDGFKMFALFQRPIPMDSNTIGSAWLTIISVVNTTGCVVQAAILVYYFHIFPAVAQPTGRLGLFIGVATFFLMCQAVIGYAATHHIRKSNSLAARRLENVIRRNALSSGDAKTEKRRSAKHGDHNNIFVAVSSSDTLGAIVSALSSSWTLLECVTAANTFVPAGSKLLRDKRDCKGMQRPADLLTLDISKLPVLHFRVPDAVESSGDGSMYDPWAASEPSSDGEAGDGPHGRQLIVRNQEATPAAVAVEDPFPMLRRAEPRQHSRVPESLEVSPDDAPAVVVDVPEVPIEELHHAERGLAVQSGVGAIEIQISEPEMSPFSLGCRFSENEIDYGCPEISPSADDVKAGPATPETCWAEGEEPPEWAMCPPEWEVADATSSDCGLLLYDGQVWEECCTEDAGLGDVEFEFWTTFRDLEAPLPIAK